PLGERRQIAPFETNLAAHVVWRGIEEPHEREGESGLAAARFAAQSHDGAAGDFKRNAGKDGPRAEIDTEIANLEQRLGRHSPHSIASRDPPIPCPRGASHATRGFAAPGARSHAPPGPRERRRQNRSRNLPPGWIPLCAFAKRRLRSRSCVVPACR